MYFSRIHIRTGGFDPEKLLPVLSSQGYADHALLWKLFSGNPDAKRDFLYRREEKNGRPFYYMVSNRKPTNPSGLFFLESKTYQPQIRKGELLAFSLRANPVVTRKDEQGKRKRHDVIMNVKKDLKAEEKEIVTPEIVTGCLIDWLADRAEKSGFAFETAHVSVENYLRHRIVKPGRYKAIRFSTVDFMGLLRVTDEELFIHKLYRGIGPAKAFGCGLLLVKRR